jgi:hypothetical protein
LVIRASPIAIKGGNNAHAVPVTSLVVVATIKSAITEITPVARYS